MAPVCLLQDGRNRKYSAAASCLFLGGLCVTCIRSKTVTNVSLNLCTNRLELPPRGLSASSILKTDPHRSKNSKVNVDMFPRSFSLFWSIATKQHMQAYIFLVLAQCQKQHSECVAVSIKEYRTFGRDQCREHLSYRCFLVVTFQDCSFVRGGESLPYIWKFFHQDSHLHLDGGRVLQENDVSKVTDDAVQPGGARFLR